MQTQTLQSPSPIVMRLRKHQYRMEKIWNAMVAAQDDPAREMEARHLEARFAWMEPTERDLIREVDLERAAAAEGQP